MIPSYTCKKCNICNLLVLFLNYTHLYETCNEFLWNSLTDFTVESFPMLSRTNIRIIEEYLWLQHKFYIILTLWILHRIWTSLLVNLWLLCPLYLSTLSMISGDGIFSGKIYYDKNLYLVNVNKISAYLPNLNLLFFSGKVEESEWNNEFWRLKLELVRQ